MVGVWSFVIEFWWCTFLHSTFILCIISSRLSESLTHVPMKITDRFKDTLNLMFFSSGLCSKHKFEFCNQQSVTSNHQIYWYKWSTVPWLMIHNTEYSDHTRQKIETLQEHLYYVELDFLQIFRPFCFAVFEIFDWQIFDFRFYQDRSAL